MYINFLIDQCLKYTMKVQIGYTIFLWLKIQNIISLFTLSFFLHICVLLKHIKWDKLSRISHYNLELPVIMPFFLYMSNLKGHSFIIVELDNWVVIVFFLEDWDFVGTSLCFDCDQVWCNFSPGERWCWLSSN